MRLLLVRACEPGAWQLQSGDIGSVAGPLYLLPFPLAILPFLCVLQVCEHLQRVGRVCGIWVVPIVGGISAQKQERLLSKRPQVGCCGRVV